MSKNLVKRILADSKETKNDNEVKCIRTDIIVHKRICMENVLACEIKKSTTYSKHEILYDLLKLEFYCKELSLEYNYGLFIRFFVGKTKEKLCDLVWFNREKIDSHKGKIFESILKKELI